MKNKKGFTLIELLAVIVILAIIALIAVPIILNMINQANKSAAKSSALGYIDAIEYNNGFAAIEQPGYTSVIGENLNVSDISIKLKGKKPSSGTVTVNSKGKVESAKDLCFNGYAVDYDGKDVEIVGKCSGTPKPQVLAKCKKNSTSLTTGTVVICDVNGDGVYDNTDEKFYYVSDYYDTSSKTFDSSYATLIYAYNTINGEKDTTTNTVYGSSNGPSTLKDNLPSTTQWSNITLKSETRNILDESGKIYANDYSYSGKAARLLTYQEVVKACNDCDPSSANALNGYEFLFDNLTPVGPYPGYWLETLSSAYGGGAAWLLYGETKQASMTYTYLEDRHAPRPAIDIKKTDIQ